MTKSLFAFAALLALAGTSLADSYRVHYSMRGPGREITVQAESSSEARRVVMEMFAGAVVTGVRRVYALASQALYEQTSRLGNHLDMERGDAENQTN